MALIISSPARLQFCWSGCQSCQLLSSRQCSFAVIYQRRNADRESYTLSLRVPLLVVDSKPGDIAMQCKDLATVTQRANQWNYHLRSSSACDPPRETHIEVDWNKLAEKGNISLSTMEQIGSNSSQPLRVILPSSCIKAMGDEPSKPLLNPESNAPPVYTPT